MKSFTIQDKEYEFNRATTARLAVVEGLVAESELFGELIDLSKIWKEDKEKFAKLAGEWERFCNEVFKGGFVPEMALENVLYTDEVWGASAGFFISPHEATMKRIKEQAELSKTTTTSR